MKSHIVLDSRLGRPLIDPDDAGYDFAVHTLMHEAAHAHDLQIQYRCVPGFYGSPIKSFCERTLVELTLGAWDEYIASRLSAPWGTRKYVPSFEVELIVMLASVRQRGNGAVTEYNEHHEIVTTATKMVSIYGSLLVRASYILGHVDGIGTDLAVQAPRWSQLVESTPWFSPYWTQYCSVLRSMHSSYGEWSGVSVLDPLKSFFQLYLIACVLLLRPQPDGGCSAYFRFF